jgi:glycosyltransferase involved in cell wall biosynthesis
MKILLVHEFYRNFGGEDAAALAEMQLLQHRGAAVVPYTRHNNEIQEYSGWEKLAMPARAIYSRRTRTELRRMVEQHRPDLAYVHNFFPLISPAVYHTLNALGLPCIQAVHDFRMLCPNGLFYTRNNTCERCKHGNYLHAVRYRCYRNSYLASAVASSVIGLNRLAGVLRKIDAYVCLTEFTRQKLLEVGIPDDKLFVKPNFVDAAAIEPRPESGEYALFLGRLSAEKGLWTLLAAFAQLPHLPLKIAGSGPLEGDLRQFVKQKNLRNVEFVGFVSGPAKWDLLRGSRFVVLPSECYETFCLAALEAYAAGKAVLASRLGSLSYVVEEAKTGLLFEAGNAADLVAKLQEMLACPDLERMGSYGRKLAETRYGADENFQTLMRIFGRFALIRPTVVLPVVANEGSQGTCHEGEP